MIVAEVRTVWRNTISFSYHKFNNMAELFSFAKEEDTMKKLFSDYDHSTIMEVVAVNDNCIYDDAEELLTKAVNRSIEGICKCLGGSWATSA